MTLSRLTAALCATGFALSPVTSLAEGAVNIAPDLPNVAIDGPDGTVVIERVQDVSNTITGDFGLTSRACPPFCVQPMVPAPGVTPIGELEVLAMLQDPDALVIDSRVAAWYAKGTIPGSVHIPYTEIADRLDDLGCDLDFDGFICEAPRRVALFCNGNWCGQSPTAIRRMVAAGYPADRIFYYRGGMQAWQMLGLTVAPGN